MPPPPIGLACPLPWLQGRSKKKGKNHDKEKRVDAGAAPPVGVPEPIQIDYEKICNKSGVALITEFKDRNVVVAIGAPTPSADV